MTLKIPHDGEDAMLKDALGKTTPADLTLKLYTNNYTPVAGSTAGSFTEMSGQGYSAKTLTMASWSETQAGGVASASYAAQTWTFSAGGPTTIYGYYVVGGDGIIRFAEKFSSPFVAQFSGDAIICTPVFTFQSA